MSRVLRGSVFPPILILMSILWLAALPLIAARSCGLIVAHDHILLGSVTSQALLAHESTEADCASGRTPVAQADSHPTQESHEYILSMVRVEPGNLPVMLGLERLMLPVLWMSWAMLALYVWRATRPVLSAESATLFLPDPPPRFS